MGLTGVNNFLLLQVSCLVASGSRLRSYFRVNILLVFPQVRYLGKCLSAMGADVRPFTIVNPLVTLHVSF